MRSSQNVTAAAHNAGPSLFCAFTVNLSIPEVCIIHYLQPQEGKFSPKLVCDCLLGFFTSLSPIHFVTNLSSIRPFTCPSFHPLFHCPYLDPFTWHAFPGGWHLLSYFLSSVVWNPALSVQVLPNGALNEIATL